MLPFDLHVLGLPPAFTLSQDQTLHLKFSRTNPLMLRNAESAQLHYSLYVYLRTNTLKLMVLIERLLMDNCHHQTPAQVTCAHCQRSWTSASAPRPAPQRSLSPEGAAHHTRVFVAVNTLRCTFFTLPSVGRSRRLEGRASCRGFSRLGSLDALTPSA